MKIQLTSAAFQHGQTIPVKYTCEGPDISPPLRWTDVPPNTKSLALICDDPDAPVGIWVHWVLYSLPPGVTELEENLPPDETLPNKAKHGMNDFKRIGYGGPCPPPGGPHRYYFRIYALDSTVAPEPPATKRQLLEIMEGHILAEGELMGTYQRQSG